MLSKTNQIEEAHGRCLHIGVVVPNHLYRRLNKIAREKGVSLSRVARDILSEKFGYVSKQYMSKTSKIYLERVNEETEVKKRLESAP